MVSATRQKTVGGGGVGLTSAGFKTKKKTSKVLVVVAEESCEIETFILLRVLKRFGSISVETACCAPPPEGAGADTAVGSEAESGDDSEEEKPLYCRGVHFLGGATFVCDFNIHEIHSKNDNNNNNWDMIIIPHVASHPGVDQMHHCEPLHRLLRDQHERGAWIAAGGASPALILTAILPKLIRERRVTCFPFSPWRRLLPHHMADHDIVVDGNVVTCQGPGSAFSFALLLGELVYATAKKRANQSNQALKAAQQVAQTFLVDRYGTLGVRYHIQLSPTKPVSSTEENDAGETTANNEQQQQQKQENDDNADDIPDKESGKTGREKLAHAAAAAIALPSLAPDNKSNISESTALLPEKRATSSSPSTQEIQQEQQSTKRRKTSHDDDGDDQAATKMSSVSEPNQQEDDYKDKKQAARSSDDAKQASMQDEKDGDMMDVDDKTAGTTADDTNDKQEELPKDNDKSRNEAKSTSDDQIETDEKTSHLEENKQNEPDTLQQDEESIEDATKPSHDDQPISEYSGVKQPDKNDETHTDDEDAAQTPSYKTPEQEQHDEKSANIQDGNP